MLIQNQYKKSISQEVENLLGIQQYPILEILVFSQGTESTVKKLNEFRILFWY